MKAYRERVVIAAFILSLGTRWRGMVSLRPRPVCPKKNISRYTLEAGCTPKPVRTF